MLLTNNLERARCLSFVGDDKGNADLDAFRVVAKVLTLLLDEVRLPPFVC